MKKILVIAAHPDDEFLSCGACLLLLKKKGSIIKTIFLADGESSRELKKNKIELINKREDQAKSIAKKSKFLKPSFLRLPDNRLDTVPFLKIVKFLESEIKIFRPDTVFTHFENDLNIDHQITYKAVLTATRPHSKTFVKKICCFETPSSTEFSFTRKQKKLFNPNLFIDIGSVIDKKIKLLKIYKNEIRSWPHSRSLKSIKNLASFRGSQIGVKFAEAFILLRELR